MPILRSIFLVFLAGCASDPWTRTDTALETAYLVTLAADAWTTTRIQYDSNVEEQSALTRSVLGSQPGTADTWQYFAIMGLSHYLVSRALPERWRRYWQGGTTAVNVYYVVNNCELGLCD